MQRLITGLILMAAFVATVRAPPFVFAIGATVVIPIASWECYRMLEHLGVRPFRWFGILTCLALVSTVWYTAHAGHREAIGPELPLVAGTIVALILAMARRPSVGEMFDAARATLFPVAFIALPLSYVIGLRYQSGAPDGALVWLLFVVVFFCDTGAYYIGSKIGKRRLAPILSPNKSVEGAVGGMLVGVGGAFLVRALLLPELGLAHTAILGVLLASAGILGDLAESLVKRATGVKDSSTLLPGHGGILDRIDSLLFSAPILYYYWTFFVQGSM